MVGKWVKRTRFLFPKQNQRFKAKRRTRVWWDLENSPLPTQEINPMLVDVHEHIRGRLYDEGERQGVEVFAIMGYTNSAPHHVLTALRANSRPMVIMSARDEPRPIDPEEVEPQLADIKIKQEIDEWIDAQSLRWFTGREFDKAMVISGDKGFGRKILDLRSAGHYTMVAFNPESEDFYMNVPADRRWLWRLFLGLPMNPPPELARIRKNRANQRRKYRRRAAAQGNVM